MAYLEDWPSAMWQDDEDEIQAALNVAGYIDDPPTEEALRECFLDYVDAGYWANLTLEDARDDIQNGDITRRMMIDALRRG